MTRLSWLLELTSPDMPGHKGIGECAPLPDLSCDYAPDYEETLRKMCDKFMNEGQIDYKEMRDFPSMLFGLETALKHFECGSINFYDTPFSRGEAGIPINGLVWMELSKNDAAYRRKNKARFQMYQAENRSYKL